jgi:PII-like signaling protein
MSQIYLKVYVSESQKHHGMALYEWLLEEAKKMGIPGGSAYRAIAGYGRHGVMHEETFFELAGNLPIEVEFVLGAEEAEKLLKAISDAGLKLFYVRFAADCGVTG